MDQEDENWSHRHYNNTNGFDTMDHGECEEQSTNYYYIDLDKIVNRFKRYSCTCLSGKGSCTSHDTNNMKPTQKLTVPLHRRPSIDNTLSKQEVGKAKKGELSEIDKETKKEMERESFRKWLLDKAKQKEEKIKTEKQQLLRKQQEAEEKTKMRKQEGELRYKLWLKEKELEYLGNLPSDL